MQIKGYSKVPQALGASTEDVEMASETKNVKLKMLQSWVSELEEGEKPNLEALKECAWGINQFFTEFQNELTNAEKSEVISLQKRLIVLNREVKVELITDGIGRLDRCKMACSRVWEWFSSCFAWRKS